MAFGAFLLLESVAIAQNLVGIPVFSSMGANTSTISNVATLGNPIEVASAMFLGYRNSSNTQTLRDQGYSGRIGDTWLLSFGDGVGTKNIARFDSSAPVGSEYGPCAIITARNGAAVQGDDPLSYTDISTAEFGGCDDVLQMSQWCPLLPGEEQGQVLWLSNVLEVNQTHGCVWTMSEVSKDDASPAGAGLAVVNVETSDANCSRPFGRTTWGSDEPEWGTQGALAGNDGYSYVFANGYDFGVVNTRLVLARAPKEDVFDVSAYEYYHGNGTWTSDRIMISSLSDTAPENLDLQANQGTAFYSQYYESYVYLSCNLGVFYAATAARPEGPWSDMVKLYEDQEIWPVVPYDYGSYIMEKYFSDDGRKILFAYSRGSMYEGVAEVTFVASSSQATNNAGPWGWKAVIVGFVSTLISAR